MTEVKVKTEVPDDYIEEVIWQDDTKDSKKNIKDGPGDVPAEICVVIGGVRNQQTLGKLSSNTPVLIDSLFSKKAGPSRFGSIIYLWAEFLKVSLYPATRLFSISPLTIVVLKDQVYMVLGIAHRHMQSNRQSLL